MVWEIKSFQSIDAIGVSTFSRCVPPCFAFCDEVNSTIVTVFLLGNDKESGQVLGANEDEKSKSPRPERGEGP